MEAAIDSTLINALLNSGLAASPSEARRMAQEMVGTSKRVEDSFEEKKNENLMFSYSREKKSPAEQPLPTPEVAPVQAAPTAQPVQTEPAQAPAAEEAPIIQHSTPMDAPVSNTAPVQEAPQNVAMDPDAYAASKFGGMHVSDLTQEAPVVQQPQENNQNASQEAPSLFSEPVTENTAQPAQHPIDPQIPQEEQVRSQLLENPNVAPVPSSFQEEVPATQSAEEISQKLEASLDALEHGAPVSESSEPVFGNVGMTQAAPVQEAPATAPVIPAAPVEQQAPASSPVESGPKNIVETALDNAATTDQQAIPEKEPAAGKWTEEEQKLREQADITKLFNFSGSKS